MTRTLKIGVLETGLPPEELAPDFGNYPSMVESWLTPLSAKYDTEFTFYPVLSGDIPTDGGAADIWVITGSKFGVYEDHSCIAPLEELIRDAKAKNALMIGICFGHQLRETRNFYMYALSVLCRLNPSYRHKIAHAAPARIENNLLRSAHI